MELRYAALRNPAQDISPEDRDRILERKEVTQEELRRFVEVRGDDLEFMAELWEEALARIEGRLRGEAPEPDA